jgi:hypothetical protein
MKPAARRLPLAFGALYGFALAAVPAVTVWDDAFTVSPFLVAAFVCAMLSGALGARLALTGRGRGRAFPEILKLGGLFALYSAALAGPSIWLMMAVNMSGFSESTPLEILNLLRRPAIFVESAVVGVVVTLYAFAAGLLLSPLTGAVLRHASRPGR